MISRYILIYLFSVFISSISQILLKKSARIKYDKRIREYLNVKVITAYSIFVISTILTILALRGVPLKSAPIISSFSYIYILILGRLILKERITKKKLMGNILIIIGIIIFHL